MSQKTIIASMPNEQYKKDAQTTFKLMVKEKQSSIITMALSLIVISIASYYFAYKNLGETDAIIYLLVGVCTTFFALIATSLINSFNSNDSTAWSNIKTQNYLTSVSKEFGNEITEEMKFLGVPFSNQSMVMVLKTRFVKLPRNDAKELATLDEQLKPFKG